MQLRAQVDIEFRPGGHGRHHCLEPQQPGDTELAQSQAVFAGQLLGGAVGLIRMGGIADMAQLTEHLAQRQLPVGPAHLQAMVGQVQPRLGNGGQAAQVFFDQPATGGAADAFHQQGRFSQFALVVHEGFLHVRAVVQRQFIHQLHRQRFGVGRGFAAVLVIAFQTCGHDCFGHRLAARAAEFAALAEDIGGEPAAGRYGQGAVVAGSGGGHGSGSLVAGKAPSPASRLLREGCGSVGAGLPAMREAQAFISSGLRHPATVHHPTASLCRG